MNSERGRGCARIWTKTIYASVVAIVIIAAVYFYEFQNNFESTLASYCFFLSIVCVVQTGISMVLTIVLRVLNKENMFSGRFSIFMIVVIAIATLFFIVLQFIASHEMPLAFLPYSIFYYLMLIGVLTWFDSDTMEKIVSAFDRVIKE